ncbi:hypothetical protein DPEC_G00169690 [Dallia pectoralis]|uniref:Uncharacterized protein n=1 Tax=Dallia pectoralis TaxID=75939 RepID=A0ACC2GCZ4_DALPE|nr:hypothetical protein DPEC_G00169690 [Dallia pectoralis]
MMSKTVLFILGLHLNLLGNAEAQNCHQGFKAVRQKCVDENECENEGICGPNATCVNTDGNYTCTCQSGFASTTKTFQCSDINECLETPNTCDNSSKCVNTIGGYQCQCRHGFTKSTHRGHCEDIDECKANAGICGVGRTCINLEGGYTCLCNDGYSNFNRKQAQCLDIDECIDDVCGVGGTCSNQEGSYSCLCKPGYSNYGNEQAQCSELTCDKFKADKTNNLVSALSGILSVMENSCLALSNSTGGTLNGEGLLKNVTRQMDAVLSHSLLGDSREVSSFLVTVEKSMKLIARLLKGNDSIINETHTVGMLEVRRGETPPTGPIRLANEHAQLDTYWETVTGNGTYQGFAVAGLVIYKNLEKSVNNSFHELTDTTTDRKPSYQIASKVVTALVSNPHTDKLDQAVLLTFKHLQTKAESLEMNYTCVFWAEGRGQNVGGAWSRRGCAKVLSNSTHTQCSCDHLSSFAVLMALYPMQHSFQLRLLTWVGLSVSLVCLLLCILTFRLCRSIQGTRNTIHLHLCLCLFIADLVFLAGISETQNKGGCGFVAGLLHLFFLASFCWMLLEGIQLYRMLMLVFNSAIRTRYLYAVGYGLPLAVVLISAAAYPDGYGTKEHCWLSLEKGFIWSFFGPVCAIILFNAFFFIVTVWRLVQKFSSLNPDLSNLQKIRTFTVTAVAQLCVLGIMWIFGVFQFQEEGTMVMTYVFTILNSLQGALLFIMHCLLNKTVREEYVRLLSCICTQQKKDSDYSSYNPSSSRSQGSKSGQNTGESDI